MSLHPVSQPQEDAWQEVKIPDGQTSELNILTGETWKPAPKREIPAEIAETEDHLSDILKKIPVPDGRGGTRWVSWDQYLVEQGMHE